MTATSRRYAARTDVSTERSRAAIERLLVRYGAERFAYGWEPGKATLAFTIAGRSVRVVLALPDPSEVAATPTGRPRSSGARATALAQAERQRWRALELVVHAKLEAVEAGISTVEDEFLAWTILPDGSTVAERLQPQIAASLASGRMPLLLGPGD